MASILTDSEKLDQLLLGFESLQLQYREIKEDHKILQAECQALRQENQRLKNALLSMSNGTGKDYLQCADLIQENIDLKQNNASLTEVLEQYKTMLEERNEQLKLAVDQLVAEKAKKACRCFMCKFLIWAGVSSPS